MPVSVKSFRENVPQKDSSPSQQAIYTSLGIGPASAITSQMHQSFKINCRGKSYL
jgi:hypothetical protein